MSLLNDENINTIILGDSHTEHIRTEEILNLSLPGSPYFIWIDLLQHVDLANKKVFVSVSPCNFSNLYQSRLCDRNLNPGWNERYLVEFSHLLKILNFKITLYPEELIKCYQSFKFDNNIPEQTTIKNFSESLDKTINKHFNTNLCVDSVQKNSFEGLLVYLRKEGASVNLIEMPLHTDYKDAISDSIWRHYNVVLEEVNINGEILRAKAADNMFYDGDHILSQKQLEVFTNALYYKYLE